MGAAAQGHSCSCHLLRSNPYLLALAHDSGSDEPKQTYLEAQHDKMQAVAGGQSGQQAALVGTAACGQTEGPLIQAVSNLQAPPSPIGSDPGLRQCRSQSIYLEAEHREKQAVAGGQSGQQAALVGDVTHGHSCMCCFTMFNP